MRLRRRSATEPVAADSDAARASYDEVPYPGFPFERTHPSRLAAQARLFGLDPAPVQTARVLELGCGDGGNLVPMAHGLPDATFVGIDLNERALGRGRVHATRLGLANVELAEGDLSALDTAALGRFDYVIAHGVYSWVPPAARDGLLKACGDVLRGDGVAYISYNALPGWYLRSVTRDLMLRAIDKTDDPGQRLIRARGALQVLGSALEGEDAYRPLVQHNIERVLERSDAGLFHDDLAEPNDPVYFRDFLAHAERHGLKYVGESELFGTSHGNLSEPVERALDTLAGDDELDREQQLDFLQLRMFHETLLCRRQAKRAGSPQPEAIDPLYAAASLKPDKANARLDDRSPVRFVNNKDAAITIDHPAVKAALARLGEAWPARVPVTKLTADGPAHVRHVLVAGCAANLIELSAHAAAIAGTPGERPLASPLARLEIENGAKAVTTLRHQHVKLRDELAYDLLRLLDGSRDRSALVAAMRELGAGRDAERRLEASLERLLGLSLLVRES